MNEKDTPRTGKGAEGEGGRERDCGGGGGGGKKDEEEEDAEEEWLTGRPQQTRSKPNLPVLPLATTTTYRTITCNQSISGLCSVSPSLSLSRSRAPSRVLSPLLPSDAPCAPEWWNPPRSLHLRLTWSSPTQRKKLFSPRTPRESILDSSTGERETCVWL